MRAIVSTALVLLVACTGTDPATTAVPTPGGDRRTHVVFDTDLAFDDIMALLYLLRRDDVTIDAVTIAGTGEAHCDPGVRNAKALLALGGAPDVPVACGRETPLSGTNAFPDAWRTAVDDLSMVDLPDVEATPDPRGAVGVLLDELDGETILLTLGPLTNVAEALREDPSLADRVPSFLAMAGAVDVPGNAPGGLAEFNVWVDPLAAREVLDAMDVSLVPLDATQDVPFTAYFVDALSRHLDTPEAQAVADIIEANEAIFTSEGYQFWDTLAAALVLDPTLATWDDARVSTTASDVQTAGWIDRSRVGAPVRFADSVPDPLAFEREYLSTISGEPVDDVRPASTLSIRFDGRRCRVEPLAVPEGEHHIAFESSVDGMGAALVAVDGLGGYRQLRRVLGAQGSAVPLDDPLIQRIEPVAYAAPGLTPAELPRGIVAAACASGSDGQEVPRAWLAPPIVVGG